MSIRKQYPCCQTPAQDLAYIEKLYPGNAIAEARETLLRPIGDALLDDGLEDGEARRRPLTDLHVNTYSLNKRKRWTLATTLPELMKDLMMNESQNDDLPVTCIIRKIDGFGVPLVREPGWQAHACNVVAVASTAFPPRCDDDLC